MHNRSIPLYHLKLQSAVSSTMQCVMHNTQSLSAHIHDIRSNPNLLAADLLILSEARIQQTTDFSKFHFEHFYLDSGETSSCAGLWNVVLYEK